MEHQHNPADAGASQPASVLEQTRLMNRWFISLVLSAIIVASASLPWKMTAFVFLIPAVVLAVLLFVRGIRHRSGLSSMIGLITGSALCALLSMSLVAQLVLWPAQARYEECMDGAITQSARIKCSQELRRAPFQYLTGK
ncbi:MAG: hypothetical protein CSA58_07140 [Micrococcales bacterium]|nr:MAG: hypothetical protein CSB46_06655 [Micrococcales bacterium]PIE26871.1 MAG: hypothetical protein CSA58_07140 [Micrococcales bacterium]